MIIIIFRALMMTYRPGLNYNSKCIQRKTSQPLYLPLFYILQSFSFLGQLFKNLHIHHSPYLHCYYFTIFIENLLFKPGDIHHLHDYIHLGYQRQNGPQIQRRSQKCLLKELLPCCFDANFILWVQLCMFHLCYHHTMGFITFVILH